MLLKIIHSEVTYNERENKEELTNMIHSSFINTNAIMSIDIREYGGCIKMMRSQNYYVTQKVVDSIIKEIVNENLSTWELL